MATTIAQALDLMLGLTAGLVWPREPRPSVFTRETWINLFNGALLFPLRLALTLLGLEALHVGLVPLGQLGHPVLQFLFVFLTLDFTRYWVHRADHRVPFLWSFHRVHHSSLTLDWLAAHQPDVIICVNLPDTLGELRTVLSAQRRRVPNELGVAVLSHLVQGTGFSGLQQNQLLMGAWAVELLAARIANRDLGIPANPRIEMVESEWIDGGSLPALGRSQPLT